MTLLALAFFIGNFCCDTAGQIAFKAASLHSGEAVGITRWSHLLRSPLLWAGIAFFALEGFMWLGFLSLVPLSQGIMMGSLNIVGVMLGGRLMLGEEITGSRVAAIGLIAVGVAVVGWATP